MKHVGTCLVNMRTRAQHAQRVDRNAEMLQVNSETHALGTRGHGATGSPKSCWRNVHTSQGETASYCDFTFQQVGGGRSHDGALFVRCSGLKSAFPGTKLNTGTTYRTF